MTTESFDCPDCQADLRNNANVFGVEIPVIYDGVLYYECAFCGHRWHRFPEQDRRYKAACEYVDAPKSGRPTG